VRIVNYDAWLMSDIDFDRFHGFGNEKAEPSDYATEAAMEKIIKEKRKKRCRWNLLNQTRGKQTAC